MSTVTEETAARTPLESATGQPPHAEPSPAGGASPRVLSPTRVAIVGAGFIADFHLEILSANPDVDVVCVCDANATRAEAAAAKFGVERAVTTLEEVAELGVQVAHVAVPPTAHVHVARRLLELGVGVFVEKPLALSSEDARELRRLADERGLPLAVNHNAVFHPAFVQLMDSVRAGDIGRVEHVQVTLSVPLRQLDAGDFSHWMFSAPRNIIFEQAPHPFAQLNELLGRVRSAKTQILKSRELQPGQVFHQRWLIAAEGERGTAEIYLSFGSDFTRSTIQVLGTDGSLQADLFHNQIESERKTLYLDFWNSFSAGRRRAKQLKQSANRGLYQYLRQTLGLGPREDSFFAGMRESMRAFHRALRAGERLPAGGDEGVHVLEWCEAATEGIAGDPLVAPTLPSAGPVREGEVVILGGTGFIGRPTVRKLVDAGVPVTCIVRRAHSLPPFLLELAEQGQVRLVKGSLEDRDSMRELVRGASCVVQLATGGGSTWADVERAMVQGSLALAEACEAEGVERFIYASSSAALYLGRDAGRQLSDEVGPDPQPGKRPLYARGKIEAEKALLELNSRSELGITIVRPSVVLGLGTPMQHSGLGLWVRDNHCVGWGEGNTPLALVWVDDVADALSRLVQYQGRQLDGKALNLAANTGLTAQDVVAELRRVTGRDLHFHARMMELSQTMELGKWLVKKAGRKQGVEFPSWRDLKSRAMVPSLSCETARRVLGWQPTEDRERFLDVAVRCYAPEDSGAPDAPAGSPATRAKH